MIRSVLPVGMPAAGCGVLQYAVREEMVAAGRFISMRESGAGTGHSMGENGASTVIARGRLVLARAVAEQVDGAHCYAYLRDLLRAQRHMCVKERDQGLWASEVY